MRRRLGPLIAMSAVLCALAAAPTSAGTDPGLVAIRSRYFGAANVDQSTGAVRTDRVILSWFGVTNFAAAIGGHVVLLDAWVPRGEYSGYVPSSPAELAGLKPEYIFVGHGHFDHMADGAEVMRLSPATTLVGTPEHCAQVRDQAMGAPVRCIAAVPEAADPGAADLALSKKLGWKDVSVRVMKHIHSAARQADQNDPHTPTLPPPDVGAVAEHLPGPADTVHLLSHLGDDEAGVLIYRFDVGSFSFAWHDSSGPLKQDAPELLTQMARDLAPVDVELGAIMGFNQITNGLADPRTYTEALHPQVFVPTHHDNWAPPVSTKAENYRPFVEAELREIPDPQRPVLQFLIDPDDYVSPEILTFGVNDARWASPASARPQPRTQVKPRRATRRPLPATGVNDHPVVVLGAALILGAGVLIRIRRVTRA